MNLRGNGPTNDNSKLLRFDKPAGKQLRESSTAAQTKPRHQDDQKDQEAEKEIKGLVITSSFKAAKCPPTTTKPTATLKPTSVDSKQKHQNLKTNSSKPVGKGTQLGTKSKVKSIMNKNKGFMNN